MFVIAGLGNPGRQYEKTRHNMGFLAADEFAAAHGIDVRRIKHKALVGEGRIAGEKVLVVKPQTYMNLSGESLREVMRYYDVPMENLIVIYDDMDLEAGTLRIRKKGSAGSHNGMKSVIYQLQSDAFPRIRIGIGGTSGEEWKDYVTGQVSEKEAPALADAIRRAAAAAECIITDGVDIAMNRFNTSRKREKKQDETQEEKHDDD